MNSFDLRGNRAHSDVVKIATRLRGIGSERAEIGWISRRGFRGGLVPSFARVPPNYSLLKCRLCLRRP
jgi:hypothetical protein